jgi:hypothetical protein
MTKNSIAVSRRIPASADKLFALLADPAHHPEIDGSGMLREAVSPRPVTSVGDDFVMKMHHHEFGDYEMTNHVIAFDPGRRVEWMPERIGGEPGRYRWGYELTPDGSDATVVTETFDCSESPQWLKEATQGGDGWREAMEASLVNLEQLSR